MRLGVGSSTSRPWRSPGLLFLGLLLLPAVVTHTNEDPEEGERELQCMCVKITSGVHPKHIMSLEVIRAGPHCPTSQLIATLKNGRKICLDPQTPRYKKTMKKFMESRLLTA